MRAEDRPSRLLLAAGLVAGCTACAPREETGLPILGAPGRGRARGAASTFGFSPHVEFAVSSEPAAPSTGEAVDWGGLRLLVRVAVPLEEAEAARLRAEPASRVIPALAVARAEAERMASTLAAGVRADARDTVANLVTDAGALRRWIIGVMRPVSRRLLPTDRLEEVYEVPLTGAGGMIDRLYERASRTADTPGRSVPGPGSAEASARSVPTPSVIRALPATTEGRWGIDWSLGFFKGLLAEVSSPAARLSMVSSPQAAEPSSPKSEAAAPRSALAPVIVIDARGTGLAPALFPQVLDERGEAVYSAAAARREYVVRDGLVQYVEVEPGAGPSGLDKALAAVPMCRRYVVVKAQAAEGPLRANVVLGAEDARRLKAEARALEEARVVIVIGD